MPLNELERCGECGGTGEIVNDGPYSRCDDCKGAGRITESLDEIDRIIADAEREDAENVPTRCR